MRAGSDVQAMQTRVRIFLSSTFKDLQFERDAVEACINRMALTYVGMEHFGSFAAEPLSECRRKVGEADLVILVVGAHYGSKPPGSRLSFTEIEYREAKSLGKPVLAYLENIPSEQALAQPLRRFRERLRLELGVSEFADEYDLAWQVACDIHREVGATRSPPSLKDRDIDQLRQLFILRAEATARELAKYADVVPVRTFLAQFRKLHKRHLLLLAKGDLVLAHEVLNQIHRLSVDLEREKFWAPQRGLRIAYELRETAFMRGTLISGYAPEFERTGIEELERLRDQRVIVPWIAGLPPVEAADAMYQRLARAARRRSATTTQLKAQ